MKKAFPAFMLFILVAAVPACHFHLDLLGPDKLQEKVLVPSKAKDKILVIEVEGVITSSGGPGLLSREKNPVARVTERLDAARLDKSVKAVILKLDTPGGEVTASDIIHHEITRFKKETGRPVVSMMMGTAASGGYYIAMAGDYVIAHPSTVTGSIGVISIFPDFHLLMSKFGVQVNVIKSGQAKDSGSPFRAMTDEEKDLFQAIINDYYARFLEIVTANRGKKMSGDEIRGLADGRVFTAGQALKAGLIDKTGYFEAASRKALELAGINSAKIVTYTYDPGGKTNVYAGMLKAPATPDEGYLESLLPRLRSGFYYLWLPEPGKR